MKNPSLVMLFLALAGCSAVSSIDVRGHLTREQLDQSKTPLLLVEIETTGQLATLSPTSVRGTITTWQTGDSVSLSLDEGLLTATRGFGFDRMTSDLSSRKIRMSRIAHSEFYSVLYSVLDEDNRTKFDTFQCEVVGRVPETITIIGETYITTRIEEVCVSPGIAITNTYWQSQDRTTWKSRQWISAETGYATIELLVR